MEGGAGVGAGGVVCVMGSGAGGWGGGVLRAEGSRFGSQLVSPSL